MTTLAVALLCLAARAGASDRDIAPADGLHLPAPAVLEPGRQELAGQVIFRTNYPVLAAGFTEGLPGRLAVEARGLFDHRRVDGFGRWWTFDFDEFQGALRWNPVRDPRGRGAASAAAGFSRMYTRQVDSDGRYSFWSLRFWWAETMASAGAPFGGRLTTGVRWLREVETRRDVSAVVAGLESPALGALTLVADSASWLRNPWRVGRPWAAGLRAAVGAHRVHVYASNTWGPLAPDSLYGTSTTFWNLRVTLGM